MTIDRQDPYGAFNFKVTITPKEGDPIEGGFSDASGLSTEVSYADYRDGTDPLNAPRKIPTTYKVGDVTLKRGLLGKDNVWKWIKAVMEGKPGARSTVVISLLTEDAKTTVFTWKLLNARPSKWTGPTLAAKGGTEVAMEELVFVSEHIEIE